MIHLAYIDDEPNDFVVNRIKTVLEQGGGVKCELQLPPGEISSVRNVPGDALLIDFDLAQALAAAQSSDVEPRPISYHGNTAATEVRVNEHNRPIILITRQNTISQWKPNSQETRDTDVDLILFKDDITSHPDRCRNEILSLIYGFRALSELTPPYYWEGVMKLMGASTDESSSLREANPPLEQGRWGIPRSVPRISEWIRNVVLRYPGIVYDDLHAATRLGISVTSFRTSQVQELFQPAVYDGVFREFGERWWVDRLLFQASALVLDQHVSGAVLHAFRIAFEKKFQIELSPSICVWDKAPVADQICYVLGEPVKLQNSILYFPDDRPAVMDPARISRRALAESNDFDSLLVDVDSYEAVREYWQLERL